MRTTAWTCGLRSIRSGCIRERTWGAIHLLTAHGSTAIQIEAIGDSTIDITGREHEISKAGICRYMKLREQYEASGCTDSAVLK